MVEEHLADGQKLIVEIHDRYPLLKAIPGEPKPLPNFEMPRTMRKYWTWRTARFYFVLSFLVTLNGGLGVNPIFSRG
jgi:hypothetical protein